MLQFLNCLIDNVGYLIPLSATFLGFLRLKRRRDLERDNAKILLTLLDSITHSLFQIHSAKNHLTNPSQMAIDVSVAEGQMNAMISNSIKSYCSLNEIADDDIEKLIKDNSNYGNYKHIFYTHSKGNLGLLGKLIRKFL